jgi:hypothetical protein
MGSATVPVGFGERDRPGRVWGARPSRSGLGSATVPVAVAGVPPATKGSHPYRQSAVRAWARTRSGGTPDRARGTRALPMLEG